MEEQQQFESKEIADSLKNFVLSYLVLKSVDIYPNTGQLTGLPPNPRYIKEKGQSDLHRSIDRDPHFLYAKPIIVFPYAGAYIIIAGNMRFYACLDLKILEIPCIVLNPLTPIDQLKRLMVLDNLHAGHHDKDILSNHWDIEELKDLGMEFPDLDVEPLPDLAGATGDRSGNVNTGTRDDIDPEAIIKLRFKGNLEEFDNIKAKIEEMIKPFELIILE